MYLSSSGGIFVVVEDAVEEEVRLECNVDEAGVDKPNTDR